MPEREPPESPDCAATIYTAGFSNLPLARFLDNLRTHGVQVLVDVRSKPYASYTPHFNKDRIETAAAAEGLRYLYLGRELGGIPDNPGFYDDEGHVLYDRIAGTEGFQVGIQRVLTGLRKGYCMALTCGEDDPRGCHRRLLLGRLLREQGVAVAHIMADGNLVSEAELIDEERKAPRQLSLFGGEVEEERAWRSHRPVKPQEG